MVWGTVGSIVMVVALVVVQQVGWSQHINWPDALYAAIILPLFSLAGATLVVLMRLPFLSWVLKQAKQQQWSLALLLLVSAVLFLAPIMPLFLFGEIWSVVGKLSLVLSLPFLVSYLAATYRLRRAIYASA
jgi:hypothetical protein